jgi:hypothetical protein
VIARPIYTLYDLYVVPRSAPDRRRPRTDAGGAQTRPATRLARLDLSTARTNHAAQALYESLGWVRDDVFLVYNQAVTPA